MHEKLSRANVKSTTRTLRMHPSLLRKKKEKRKKKYLVIYTTDGIIIQICDAYGPLILNVHINFININYYYKIKEKEYIW